MRGQLRIEEMYAFVALDPADNTEGVMAFLADGTWMPMVGADMKRVDQLRPMATDMAKAAGFTVRVCRFSNREEVEVINGE